jgi:hypothetical protein
MVSRRPKILREAQSSKSFAQHTPEEVEGGMAHRMKTRRRWWYHRWISPLNVPSRETGLLNLAGGKREWGTW